MAHPLVVQLRFTRNELVRALAGVSDEEARRRFPPMNCISWMLAHLTSQEHRYWLVSAQGKVLVPEVDALAAYGKPATTPPLAEMWGAWRTVTQAADPFLESMTTATLQTHPVVHGKTSDHSLGSLLQRVIYHYWFHIGESQAVRQLLGHVDLPEFVGDIHLEAPYQPEPAG